MEPVKFTINQFRKPSAVIVGCLWSIISMGQNWRSAIDSGDAQRQRRAFDSAIASYEHARRELTTDSVKTQTYGSVCRKVGEVYDLNKQRSKAIEYCIAARKDIQERAGTQNASTLVLCDYIGQLYFAIDRPKAEPYLLEAADIRLKLYGDKSREFSVSCNMLGGYYSTTGEYEKSIYYHQIARNIRESQLGKEHPEYAQSCNNIGVCYWYMGEYEKAEAFAIEAKVIREKLYNQGKEQAGYAFTCANLGNIYRDMGQYQKATTYYQLSKDIRQTILRPDDPLIIQIIHSIADINAYMGLNEEAEKNYLEARKLCASALGTANDLYATNSNNLADLYQTMGRYKEAERLFLESQEIWDKSDGINYNSALSKNSLGALYFKLGDYKKAEQTLAMARAMWDTVNDKSHPFYPKNLYNLARVRWAQRNVTEARRLYFEAFANEYDQVNKLFRFTNEAEKQKYLENIISASDESMSFFFRTGRSRAAADLYTLAVSNKTLILSSARELRRTVFENNNDSLLAQFENWAAIKQRIANLYIKSKGFSDAQMSELESQADSLEAMLSRSSSAFQKRQQRKTNWIAVRNKLKPGEAAIEYAQFRIFDGKKWTDSTVSVAIVIRKEFAQPSIELLFEEKQIDSLLQKFKPGSASSVGSLYTRGIKKGATRAMGQQLYQLVWQPLEKHLKGIHTVYYAPVGGLHKVSFAALSSSLGKSLIDEYNLIRLSSTGILTEDMRKPAGPVKEVALYGGVDYGSGAARQFFEYLQGTQREIDSIATLAEKYYVTVKTQSGSEATEASLRNYNGNSSPQILHIATHGFYFEGDTAVSNEKAHENRVFHAGDNPLFRSGLALAGANLSWEGKRITGSDDDGIFTAFEASNLYLPNTHAVVLSACETALGEIRSNEGVFGLQRAFKMAGVDYMVMSLWEVNDLPAAQFMQQFYSNLFKGRTVENAFLMAQRKMRQEFKDQPHDWAAWVLVR